MTDMALLSYSELMRKIQHDTGGSLSTHPDDDPMERIGAEVAREFAAFEAAEIEEIGVSEDTGEVTQGEWRTRTGHVSEAGWAAWLALYAVTGNQSHASRETGISKTAVRSHRRVDPDFARAFEVARSLAFERLEDVAYARATDDEYDGSDRLLMFLMEANLPGYAKRPMVEIDNSITTDARHVEVSMPEDRMRRIGGILSELGVVDVSSG